MEVILIEDVPSLGQMGESVKVAPGYGRNYLIPQKLAVLSDKRNKKEQAHHKRLVERKKIKLHKKALELLKEIDEVSVTIKKQSGSTDRLFGSVTNRDIAESLGKIGFKLDRRKIVLSRHIKSLGIYRVPIRLAPDIKGEVRVWVVADV